MMKTMMTKLVDERKICKMYILMPVGIHLQHSPGPGATCIWSCKT